jgi:hypothetical protein
MKLNINSSTAKLYRWFYGTSKMPESLCPYFWKLVLMWAFILPYSIVCIPAIVMEKLDPSETFKTGERAGISFLVWVVIACAISMLFSISLFWYQYPKDTLGMDLQVLGLMLWLIGTAYGIWHGIQWLINEYKDSKIKYDEDGRRIWNPEPKQDSIIVSFIKASYNKYCPRIDWDHKK